MRLRTLITLLVPLALAFALAPGAADAHGRGGPCREDLKALCPNATPGPGSFRDCVATLCPQVTPGPGAFGNCLPLHQDQLSPECQTHVTKMQAKIAEWQQACGADVQTLCGDVSGRHGVGKCLRQHHDELSQTCQDLLAQHHHRHHHHDHNPNATPAS